ncbi:Aquaporin-9 [Fasciola gigantica]|uniref:Aquaporin-9 n=1 Tax=Fasciola gigantica TaxID=46835 RepID=A0A504YYS1_FASGI|nr:Aquaporin-9 [Fasciola gigantica]
MSLVSYDFERYGCQSRYEETLHSWKNKLCLKRFPLLRACIGEFFGTMVLIIFGTAVLAQARFVPNVSFFSISFGWGAAVTFGVFISGKMGYGLINPAMALAMALVGKVPWIAIVPIMLCEVFGAYIGALVVYGIYEQNIRNTFNGTLNMDSGLIFVTGPSVGIGLL